MKRKCQILFFVLLFGLMPSFAAAEVVTIRIAHWLGDPLHGSGLAMMMEEVQERVAKHGIRIETTISGGDGYPEKVVTQTLGGVGPDIIFSLPYAQFGVQSLLMDLTPYLESDPELNFDSFVPVIWDIFTYNGATKLLPVGVSPYLMFFNEQYFLEAGVPFPTPEWRWDQEIPDALVKLRKVESDGNVSRYGLLLENRLWTLYFSQGGQVLSEDGTRSTVNNPDANELFEQIYRWRQDDLIPQYANHRPTFAAGRGAMHGVMGTFALPYYVEHATGIDWSFTLPPQGKAGLRIEENVNGWGISMHTNHPDEAWIVLKALADVSGIATMEALGHFSPIIGKTDGDTIAHLQDRYGLTFGEIQTALEAINYIAPRPRHPEAEEINRIVQRAFVDVAWNGRPAGPRFTTASEQIDAILAAYEAAQQ